MYAPEWYQAARLRVHREEPTNIVSSLARFVPRLFGQTQRNDSRVREVRECESRIGGPIAWKEDAKVRIRDRWDPGCLGHTFRDRRQDSAPCLFKSPVITRGPPKQTRGGEENENLAIRNPECSARYTSMRVDLKPRGRFERLCQCHPLMAAQRVETQRPV